ncbi:helix-turn-helix transcriptional regulator [Micromonospora sp. ALFpr18c]|uniref:helix-turn-helix domain-containing protein n=1 Tax=unclassified Micromonospora TaxID=2617518 RepID=UPI00124B43A7|nr:helix-turn-helix transcriptional regulator [Micromonospora sp. ALFpr18c]KAB1946096.1 helix-turn-helix transcriptional regulator [Micromonospora sp. ALFpr18c]
MRQLRDAQRISLRNLAKITYHGKTYLHELETGMKKPTSQVAQRIDDALNAAGELVALATQPTIRRREFVAAAGLAAALPHTLLGHGRHVGPGTAGRLAERTARLRRLDNFLGGADTHRLYQAEADSTTRLIQEGSYSETVGRQLLAVLAEQTQLAGWAAFDSGRHADAERLYRTSLSAARDADDHALTGNAFAFLAYQQLALGQPAADTAAAGCETASTATPTVRALLHLRAAWAYAVEGNAAAADQQLAHGTTCLTEHDDRPEPDWVYWVDHVEGEIMTGRCWTVLRRPMRAIPVLERALARFDDTHSRDKALYLSWLADAYLDANEVEQACATAGTAIGLAGGVGSVRPAQRLNTFLNRLEPHAEMPCVVELRSLAAEASTRPRLSV